MKLKGAASTWPLLVSALFSPGHCDLDYTYNYQAKEQDSWYPPIATRSSAYYETDNYPERLLLVGGLVRTQPLSIT